MSEKRAIVFIDGNNWYHNSKQVVDAKNLDLKKVAKFICDNFDLDLKQIRYYASIPSISENALRHNQNMDFLKDLEKQGIKIFTRDIEQLDLCKTCKPFVKQNCLDCIGIISIKEKGIYVKIAVDMIEKCLIENECDVCILISGEADFFPAMQIIKYAGKEVLTASVPIGYSNELRNGEFRYFYLKTSDLEHKCMRDNIKNS